MTVNPPSRASWRFFGELKAAFGGGETLDVMNKQGRFPETNITLAQIDGWCFEGGSRGGWASSWANLPHNTLASGP